MLPEYPQFTVRASGRNETGAIIDVRVRPDAGGMPPGLTEQNLAELISDRFIQIPGMSVQISYEAVVRTQILDPTVPTPDDGTAQS